MDEQEFLRQLEDTGEDGVRLALRQNRYNIDKRNLADHWLYRKQVERESARDISSDATAALARRANTIAVIAAVIATACTIITTIIAVISFLRG